MPALPDWRHQLISSLERAGPVGEAAAKYVNQQRIHLSLRGQSSGARWLPWKWIELHSRYGVAPTDPYALSLVVHEVRHLQQGWLDALSVYGELDAWQRQFRFLGEVMTWRPEAAAREHMIDELLSLPVNWDRDVLRKARALMRAYGGPRYRIDLLPLYPLHFEILFVLTGRPPAGRS
jgi:hypothetical protein